MKLRHLTLGLAALLVSATLAPTALAQHDHEHGDVPLGYEDGAIAVEFGDEGQVFEGEFPTTGGFALTTDDPGFATEFDEGLVVGPSDIIDYQILGPLVYHNGTDFAPVPAGAGIEIGDNPTGALVVDASTVGPVSGPGAIVQADGAGEFDAHVEFTLQGVDGFGASAYGAYGLLMKLTSDDPTIGDSDPFYIVFNYGLEEAVYEGAVGGFASLVPEPTSLLLAGLAVAGLASRRRAV